MRKRVVVALVLVAVSFSVVGAVEASPEGHTAPLDRGFEKVGETEVDGTEYELYRYDSLLPYASGYEVFDGATGERVGEREMVERVARAYGWETAAREEMTDDDLERIDGVATTAGRAGMLISTPFSALNTTVGVIDRLEDEEVPVAGVSAWGFAVSVVSELETAETAVRTARDRLKEWDERLGGIGDDVERAADASRALRDGGEVEYDELPQTFGDAVEGLDEAERLSSRLADDMTEAANISGDIADEVAEVRFVGGELASPLRTVADSLDTGAAAVRGFEDDARASRETLEAVSSRAADEEDAVVTGWVRRGTAAERVYATFAALVLLLAAGGYAYRRRSADEPRPDE